MIRIDEACALTHRGMKKSDNEDDEPLPQSDFQDLSGLLAELEREVQQPSK